MIFVVAIKRSGAGSERSDPRCAGRGGARQSNAVPDLRTATQGPVASQVATKTGARLGAGPELVRQIDSRAEGRGRQPDTLAELAAGASQRPRQR